MEPPDWSIMVGKEPRESHQLPVPVDRAVPVETAVKGRRQLARRCDVVVRTHDVAYFVWILLMDAVQRKTRKILNRRNIHHRLFSGGDSAQHHKQHEKTKRPHRLPYAFQLRKKRDCLWIGSARCSSSANWVSFIGLKDRAISMFSSSCGMSSQPTITVLTGSEST